MTHDEPERRDGLRRADAVAVGQLTVRSERVGVMHTISVAGELDLATTQHLQRAIEHAEASDALAIIVDLSRLQFIDSSGVRLLLQAHARSRANSNRLALLRGPASVQRVFELTGLIDTLPFAD